jgi:hypothetical protein
MVGGKLVIQFSVKNNLKTKIVSIFCDRNLKYKIVNAASSLDVTGIAKADETTDCVLFTYV